VPTWLERVADWTVQWRLARPQIFSFRMHFTWDSGTCAGQRIDPQTGVGAAGPPVNVNTFRQVRSSTRSSSS